MVALLVIFMIIAFITADVLVRIVAQRLHASKLRKERAAALDVGLNLDFTDEAKSLKRVEVENPKAKILAVDDEPVILDSFRKILVLDGFAVDTVESGREALGLIQKNDYDFVFTDLKMPAMDGLDVVKGVKHLRPDIDVIMITGYATIESAVDVMKYGALDYVQKPFTEDELVGFVNKSLIRRNAKIESQMKPVVHLVTASSGEEKSEHVFNVPAGIFISPEHTWLSIETTGAVRIGIDDFAQKTIGKIDAIEFPQKGKKVRKGEPLFKVTQNSRHLIFPSPVSGEIIKTNTELSENIAVLKVKPYELGWICRIEPADLTKDLQGLRIGASAVEWYKDEINKFREMIDELTETDEESKKEGKGNSEYEHDRLDSMNDKIWKAFSESFLHV